MGGRDHKLHIKEGFLASYRFSPCFFYSSSPNCCCDVFLSLLVHSSHGWSWCRSIFFFTFTPHTNKNRYDMLFATIAVSLYNSITLSCITPSRVGHSWRVVSELINTAEEWHDCVWKQRGLAGVWLGRDFTFDFIPQTLMLCGSCPHRPATRKQAEKFINWDGVEHEDRRRMCYSRVSQPWSAQAVESRLRTSNRPVAVTGALSSSSCVWLSAPWAVLKPHGWIYSKCSWITEKPQQHDKTARVSKWNATATASKHSPKQKQETPYTQDSTTPLFKLLHYNP